MMVAMFSLNWRMVLVAMMIFPLVLVVMLIYQRYSTPIARRVRSYLADINNGFNEVIGGMSVIQLFRQQARFGERMDAAPQRYGPDQRPLASGCLTLNNLSFAYRENRDVLSDINLEVPSRSFVALVDLPQVMILDEATANIDSGTEQAIQQTLRTLRQHSTLVVIAHRFSTITEADTILVLHRGRVVEQGNHAQLLALQGRYWQMYQIQQVGDDLATGIPLTSEE